MVTQKEIQTLSDLLTSKFDINRILIFGSYASGRPSPESDLDLCITADLKNMRKIDFIRDIRRSIRNQINVPMDILVYDDTEFTQRAAHRNTMEYQILSRGILLNG